MNVFINRAASAILMIAVMAAGSCQRVEQLEAAEGAGEPIFARIEEEPQSRTALNGNNNVVWSDKDQLTVFNKSSLPLKYQVDEGYEGKNYGGFSPVGSGTSDGSLVSGMALNHIIAYYPYGPDVECYRADSSSPTRSYELRGVTVPSEQNYAPESFGKGTFPMVAVSEDSNITFRNICGGMKLHLKGSSNVSGITVEGNDGEPLAGQATVLAYSDGSAPVIIMADEALTSVTLTCPGGVQLSEDHATAFVLTLPPTEFTKGFTVTVRDTDGRTFTLRTDKPNSVLRSNLLNMPEVVLSEADSPENPGCPYINNAVIFGDSIMHGVYSYFEEGTDGTVLRKNGFDRNSDTHLRIPDYFGLLAGATVTNNAQRGSGWITDTRGWGNALEMVNKTDFKEYDFAAFCLGINDWIQGAEIGSLDEPERTGGAISEGTVVANMMACFKKVREENPSCKVVVYSPYISWGQYSDGGDYTSKTLYGNEDTGYALGARNKAGYTLQDLIDVIDGVCLHYGIRHVPLSRSKVCTQANVKDVMIDGLHPSREVREALAAELLEQSGYGTVEAMTMEEAYKEAKDVIARLHEHVYDFPKNTDDKLVDIILFAGQSNSCGRAQLTDCVTPEDVIMEIPSDMAFSFNNTASTVPVQIVEPISANGTSTYGYIPAFINAYNTTTGRKVCACYKSVGGVMINKFVPYVLDDITGEPTSARGTYYKQMKEAVAHARTNVEANGYEVGEVMLVWCQGESEGVYLGNVNNYALTYEEGLTTDEQKTDWYKKQFTSIVSHLKDDVGLTAAFIIRIGHRKTDNTPNTPIIYAQNQLGKENDDIVLVSTVFAGAKNFIKEDGTVRNLMRDTSHYVPEGYVRAGTQAGTNAGIYINSAKQVKPVLLDYHSLVNYDDSGVSAFLY